MHSALLFIVAVFVGVEDPAIAVSAEKKDGEIEFRANDEVVAVYHHGHGVAKPFFRPLKLNGIGVTRDETLAGASTDHRHQRSGWFCHGEIIPNGLTDAQATPGLKAIDFWSEKVGHGIIECVEVDAAEKRDGTVSVATSNLWKARDGSVVLRERRVIRFDATRGTRRFIVITELRPADVAVEFGDTKEGSLGLRVADALRYSDGGLRVLNASTMIRNSNGSRGELGCWGKTADWCDVSGEIQGQKLGIAVFDHPTNRPRACWHVRNYGLLAANPFGRARSGFPDRRGTSEPVVRLKPGETLRLAYAILLHEGDAETGRVAEHYRRFAAAVP